MSSSKMRMGNPMEWDDVEIIHPRKLENASYDRSTYTIVDLDTGDALKLSKPLGPGDRPRQFGFYNLETGPYAGGSYINMGGEGSEIYVISGISTGAGADHRYRAREEFDIGRIAELFRARFDTFGSDKTVVVIDARPEKASEINPQNGTREAAQ